MIAISRKREQNSAYATKRGPYGAPDTGLDHFSLHHPQILRDLWAMQAVAAEFSGYAGEIRGFKFGKLSYPQ